MTIREFLIFSLAQTDALAKLLIEKDVITQEEFMAKIAEERATYQRMLNPTKRKGTPMAEAQYKGKRVEVEILTDSYQVCGIAFVPLAGKGGYRS